MIRPWPLPPAVALAAGNGPCRRPWPLPPAVALAAGRGPCRRPWPLPPAVALVAGRGPCRWPPALAAGRRPLPPAAGPCRRPPAVALTTGRRPFRGKHSPQLAKPVDPPPTLEALANPRGPSLPLATTNFHFAFSRNVQCT